jgi:hypothetical protein
MSDKEAIIKIYGLFNKLNDSLQPNDDCYKTTLYNTLSMSKHLEEDYDTRYAIIEYNKTNTSKLVIKKITALKDLNTWSWLVSLTSIKMFKCRFGRTLLGFDQDYTFNTLSQVYNFLTSINIKNVISYLANLTYTCNEDKQGYPAYPVIFKPNIKTEVLLLQNRLKLSEGMAYV